MRILIYFLIIISLYSCGFNIVKQSDLVDFHIAKIETVGDKKINYGLKNKLAFRAGDTEKKKIYLDIKTKKNKVVKEKNSRNEITRYELIIELLIEVSSANNKLQTLNFSEQITYNVGSQYTQTINNEDQAIKTLLETLVNKIIKELSIQNLNDI